MKFIVSVNFEMVSDKELPTRADILEVCRRLMETDEFSLNTDIVEELEE